MSLPVTVEFLLAFMIPGAITLIALGIVQPEASRFLLSLFWSDSASGAVVLGASSLIAGAIVDLIARITLTPLFLLLARLLRQKDKFDFPGDYLSSITKDDLGVFSALVQTTFFYERLSKNSFLSTALLAFCRIFYFHESSPKVCGTEIALLVVTLLLWFAAYQGQKYTASAVRGFYRGRAGLFDPYGRKL